MSIERRGHPVAHEPAGILTLIRFSSSAMSLMNRRMLAVEVCDHVMSDVMQGRQRRA